MNDIFVNRCRACAELNEGSEKMIYLFEKNISEMFTHCTSVEIASNDSLPSHLCFECFEHLSNFNNFRQNCINADTFFREQLVTESIKVEELDVIDMKDEENEPNREIKSEFCETENEGCTQYDPVSIVQNPVTSTDIPNLNIFDNTKFICDFCGKQFDKKSHIGSHMLMHKKKIAKNQTIHFRCTVEGCIKVFEKRKLLNNHRLKVHKLKPEPRIKVATVVEKKLKLRCEKCPRFWTTNQHKLDGHIRGKHEGLKPYKCPHCDKECCKYQSYVHHLRKHDIFEKKEFRCSYNGCDKEYGLVDSLKAHFNRAHLGIIPVHRNQELVCDQCGRKFVDGHSLKKHFCSHTGKMPFACKICPKAFLTNHQLKVHTMRHLKVKPFECPICGARKTTNKELQDHLNFHTKEKSYPCKECPRVFTSYGAISRHVRIHHRFHKPYICPHCQQAFAKAETMKNHVMTHTGEKPFACSVCGHRFIQSVALKTHMKVHSKKSS